MGIFEIVRNLEGSKLMIGKNHLGMFLTFLFSTMFFNICVFENVSVFENDVKALLN
jgi:hypothetical protein